MNGGKVARHKSNIQKSFAFLTLVITIRREIKKKKSLHKVIKYLEILINTKSVKYSHTKHCKH